MATKAELEQEVEQLKQQLASEKPDLAAMQAELDKLKADLDACAEDRDQAQAKLVLLEEELHLANSQVVSLQKHLDEIAAEAPETPEVDGDHVMLDGVRYDINWRSTVKDVVYEGYHKKNLDENHTALVVSKHGG